MKKRPLILFELLIALTLLALLLSVLFQFFAGSVTVDRRIQESRRVLSEREYLYTRLSNLLTSLIPKNRIPENCDSSLSSTPSTLTAIFDNGIDPDPLFSGTVMGTLSVDNKKNLILSLTPLQQTTKRRTEILLKGVDSLHFQFLAKKNAHKPSPQAQAINQHAEWRTHWIKEEETLPSVIRVMIQQETGPVAFAFLLPFPDPPILHGATP